MTRVINLTPHDLNIFDESGQQVLTTIPASGQVARVSTKQTVTGHITVDGISIPVVKTEFGDVQGLLEPQENTVYIVSSLVAQAVDRPDVLAPDTGPQSAVRDEGGRIVGVRRFQKW